MMGSTWNWLKTLLTNGTLSVAGIVTGTFSQTGLTKGGLITMMTVDATAWVEVPASALVGRNNVVVQNLSTAGAIMLWNYNPAASVTSGIQVPQGGSRSLAVTGSIPIYIRMAPGAGATLIAVEELA